MSVVIYDLKQHLRLHTYTHTAYVTVSVPSSAYMFFIARVDADTLLSVNLAYYYEMLSVN